MSDPDGVEMMPCQRCHRCHPALDGGGLDSPLC